MSAQLTIVGGGQAAAQLIDSVRRQGFQGRVTLISEEKCLPYQRPPLSKQFLAGSYDPPWLLYRPESFYRRLGITTMLGVRVEEIDRRGGVVRLIDGARVPYDWLALTTGARPRPLEISGSGVGDVCYVRTLPDVETLLHRLRVRRRVVIVGGGFIGLEVAAVLVQLRHDVTVLAAQERLLPRLVAPAMSGFLAERHRHAGVRIETGAEVDRIERVPNDLFTVHSSDGRVFDAEVVIAGIGITPNSELARDAGLNCEDGIVVDRFARTSDDSIVAAGDCTSHPNRWAGRHIRLETVHNAVEQPKSAAAAIVGTPLAYDQVPWVWSDQYSFRLQSVGFIEGYTAVVRRDSERAGSFALFYFQNERFVGMNAVNRPAEFGIARRILNAGVSLTPEQAADADFDLESLAPRRPAFSFGPSVRFHRPIRHIEQTP